MGAITALAADRLGVKPLLVFRDGTVSDLSLNRTMKSGIKSIFKKYQLLNAGNMETFIFHADNEKGANTLKEMLLESYPDLDVKIKWVGPVIGIYTGPGCVGMVFRKKDEV